MPYARNAVTQAGMCLLFALGMVAMVACTPIVSTLTATASSASSAAPGSVTLQLSGMTATISNGIYTVKFNAAGEATSLVWNGKELIGTARGFYTLLGTQGSLTPNQLQVVTNTATMADIVYVSTQGELHYVVRAGASGIYSYFVATNLGKIDEFRLVYRVDGNIFRNGYNAERSGPFPTISEIKQAKVIQNETFQLPNGTIYTKYDWASYRIQDTVHGVYGNGYGVWLIPASHEYYNGGPMKQELMVHVESASGDGTVLNVLVGSHLGSPAVTIPNGKIFGPWFIYLNNGSSADAQAQAAKEEAAWPYTWLSNPNYPLARTTVTGTLRLSDGRPAAGAMLTLAQPGGDLYAQGGDYMFSAQADQNGHFRIPKVRPGTYSLYAYATGGTIGDVTDQYESDNIAVSGASQDLGKLVWTPTKYAHTLWQIGTADRKAGEFKLGNQPRQYGLFDQVPANLTYTIGQSVPGQDWYYAQTKVGTWTVHFNLTQTYSGNAHLTVALAGMSKMPTVQILANGTAVGALPAFANDMTVYRSANQSGYYHLVPITFPASLLKPGENTLVFQTTSVSSGGGTMYDTIKLEAD